MNKTFFKIYKFPRKQYSQEHSEVALTFTKPSAPQILISECENNHIWAI